MKEEKIPDKITWEEYACITSRITAASQTKHSYNIAMYTITIAIIGVALECKNAWLFLLPYVVLFSFHRIIQNERYRINKYDAYLAIYSEDRWERNYKAFHMNLEQSYAEHPHGITKSRFVRVSALHLSAVCSLMAIFMWVYNVTFIDGELDLNRLISNTSIFDCFLVVIAVLLFFIMIFWCKNATDSMSTRDKYIEQIKQQKTSSDEVEEQSAEIKERNQQSDVLKGTSVIRGTT